MVPPRLLGRVPAPPQAQTLLGLGLIPMALGVRQVTPVNQLPQHATLETWHHLFMSRVKPTVAVVLWPLTDLYETQAMKDSCLLWVMLAHRMVIWEDMLTFANPTPLPFCTKPPIMATLPTKAFKYQRKEALLWAFLPAPNTILLCLANLRGNHPSATLTDG